MPRTSLLPFGSALDKSTTFAQSYLRRLVNKLPYVEDELNEAEIERLNPKFKVFYDVASSRKDRIEKQSVSTPVIEYSTDGGGFVIDKGYTDFVYANMDLDKVKRIQEYRTMAAYSELSDAIDEICDECIVRDDKGKIINIIFEGSDIKENTAEILRNEFNRFIEPFKLADEGWQYFRSLLIDAEVFWENIIFEEKENQKKGIVDIVRIPVEMINPIYDNVQNLIIKGFILRKPILDKENISRTQKEEEQVPMDRNQITYIHSGIWNEDMTIRLPFIENARRAYKQLSLIEDSIVIYRLVRAPERLVFKIDVGNMQTPKVQSYLKSLMHQYSNKKTYDASTGGTNLYDPQSMLDSYWFPVRNGAENTDVSVLQGGQNLGQLDDLMYFLRKLYKALKVPTTRLDPQTAATDGTEITREELKFAKFIMRLQRQFAFGIKNSFITHLKLKNLWSDLKVRENQIEIVFNPPSSYQERLDQQKFELMMNNYNTMIGNGTISKSYAQKHYLKWTDNEIKENREWLRKDAANEWEIQEILTNGPNYKEVNAAAAAAAGAAGAPGAPGGAGGGGGSASPPAFGPGPETGGGEEGGDIEIADIPSPEAGDAPAPPV